MDSPWQTLDLKASSDVPSPLDPHRPRRSLWKTPAVVTTLCLSILVIASQVIDGWNWPPRAFVVVGSLIFVTCFTYQWVTRNRNGMAYRAAVGMGFAAGFMLLWGSVVQTADVNRLAALYFGVPVVGILGAAVARLQPRGMARALFVTALAQLSVLAVLAMLGIARNPQVTTWTPPELRGFAGNVIVAMLFGGSGLLFQAAGRGESPKATG